MQSLEVGDIPSLTDEEKKSIDELLAQVKESMKDNKDSNTGACLPAESTGVKGKSLDLSIKTAVQMAVRIFKTENSSLNAELSNKINVVSNNLKSLKEKVDGHDNEIAAADKKAQDALDKINVIQEKLKEVDLKLGTLDEAIKNKVPVNLSEAQMTSIKQEVWKVISADNAKQRITKHKTMGCIFNLESTPYDYRLKPRQLFFSIVEEAGCAYLFPEYQVLKVDMNGKRCKSTHTSADRKPAMVVHFSCEELVFDLLKLKSKFREAGEAVEKKYRNVFIKKSVPQEYKDMYKKFDEIRGSHAAITVNENGQRKRVYDVRIDFLGEHVSVFP